MNESKATRYQRLRRRAQTASLAAGAVLLLGVALTPAARWLEAAVTSAAAGAPPVAQPAMALTLFVLTLALAAECVALPVSLYSATLAARRFKRIEWTGRSLVAAHARDALVGAAIALAGAGLLRVAMWAAGAWWWAVAGLLLAAVTLGAQTTLNALLGRSAETRPLSKSPLSGQLTDLARRACGRSIDLREWTSSSTGEATAVVTGMGRRGRILLSPEMVRDWTDEEISVVVAHELSHHANHDLAWKVGLDGVVWLVVLWTTDAILSALGHALGLSGVADLAALPALALVAGSLWLLVRPLRLAQSRAQERRADRFALELTGYTGAFRTAIRRLSAHHLVEDRPSRWARWCFHKHPTATERLIAAEAFERQSRRH